MVYEKRKIVKVKVYKDSFVGINKEIIMGRPARRYSKKFANHDINIIQIIRGMRRLGMCMIGYDEVKYKKYTLMKFERKEKGNGALL